MPRRLDPKIPLAPTAILTGDPGRSLLLAQELLEQPKMSNHARGLWGYTGNTSAGEALTIQATGMGGPSAAMVIADLAELGVRRTVRVGTCAAVGEGARVGELVVAGAALSAGGSATSFGVAPGETATPDATLHERLLAALGDEARAVTVASVDAMPAGSGATGRAAVADMQTLAVLARAGALGIAAAGVLIATEAGDARPLAGAELERAAARAGRAAREALSNP